MRYTCAEDVTILIVGVDGVRQHDEIEEHNSEEHELNGEAYVDLVPQLEEEAAAELGHQQHQEQTGCHHSQQVVKQQTVDNSHWIF